MTQEEVIERTKYWIESAVIGLNLCPFAKQVYVHKQIRYVVSLGTSLEDILKEFEFEIATLQRTASTTVDTTLIILPHVLGEFLDFNNFLVIAELIPEQMGLGEEIQVASFHPQYQFAGTGPDDIENYTNRAPFPILHLLRESSVSRALEGYARPEEIFANNIKTLQKLGHEGWKKLKIE